MKILLRRTTFDDLDSIYDLHLECFNINDCWYKSTIQQYLNNGLVIEIKETKQIIGVLLQGNITPCNKKLPFDNNNSDYKEDIFDYINDEGQKFYNEKKHYDNIYGIVMICIHPKYRKKGLAKKLINIHFDDNKDEIICLNTRKSNIGAYYLYKDMGYTQIAFIKNKYFLPNEDSIFMIKNNI